MPAYLIDDHLNHASSWAVIGVLLAGMWMLKRYEERREVAEGRARFQATAARVHRVGRVSVEPAPLERERNVRRGARVVLIALTWAAVVWGAVTVVGLLT